MGGGHPHSDLDHKDWAGRTGVLLPITTGACQSLTAVSCRKLICICKHMPLHTFMLLYRIDYIDSFFRTDSVLSPKVIVHLHPNNELKSALFYIFTKLVPDVPDQQSTC